jgi:hypothetical protein
VNDFTGNVSLSVSGVPTFSSGSFSPNPVAVTTTKVGASTLTVSVSTFSRRGTYNVMIKGTSGSLSHTRVVTLVGQ